MSLKDIITAIAFMSRLPLKAKSDLRTAAIYFPVVGYIAATTVYGLSLLPSNTLKPYLIIIVQYYLFNLFHFDGLLDVADGFLAQHRPKEEIIKIMKKPDTGAFAVFVGIIYISLKIKFISTFTDYFYLYPLGGRLAIFLTLIRKPALNEGLANLILPIKASKIVLYTVVYTIPIALISPLSTIILVTSSLATSLMFTSVAYKKIGGINGDILGAICEVEELLYLCLISFL